MSEPVVRRTILDRRVVLKGAKFDFEEVTLEGRAGNRLERQMVRHPGASAVLPILDDGRLVLVRNDRFAVGELMLELPAGTIDVDEDPAVCAARELREETGYEAATIEPLGRFHTTPGLTDELMHAYVARGLREVGQQLEADEELSVEIHLPSAVFGMIDRGEMTDAKSILTVLLAARRGVIDESGA